MVIPTPLSDPEPEPDIRSHHNGHSSQPQQQHHHHHNHNDQLGAAHNHSSGPLDHDFAPRNLTATPVSPPIAPTPENALSPRIILPTRRRATTISTLSDPDSPPDDDVDFVQPTYLEGFKNTIKTVPVIVAAPILCPIAWGLHFSGQSPVAVFVVSLLAIVPLAGGLSFATEELAGRLGDAWGGLLNATFGNVIELLIAILALVKGDIDIVQASMAGSILSNILLVLGMSYFAGGLRFHEQLYAVVGAQTHIALLGISVAAILLPEAYHLAYPTTTNEPVEAQLTNRASTKMSQAELKDILSMSRGLSFILLIVYGLYLTFQLYTHAYLFSLDREEENHDELPAPTHHKVFPKPNWVPSLRTVMSRDTFSNHGRNTPTPPRPFVPTTDADGHAAFNPHSRSASHVDLEQQRQATSHSVSSYLASQSKMERGDIRLRENRASDEKRASDIESQPSPIEAGRQSPESMQLPNTTVDIIDLERQRIKRKVIPKAMPKVPTYYAFGCLLIFSGLAGVTAECLVASIDGLTDNTGVSREFIGMIVLPVVGNAVEHITAVTVSLKDRLNLSLSIAVGSSVQVSLGLVPLLVLIGWWIGQPMSLLFDTYETICLVLAIIIVNAAIADGRTNFLEGAVLMMTWVCMAIVTWYYDPLH
ncbi:hypothetical protein CC85DRAFT_313933 [Cutaneotrichosporon oleaginosum]|uniref:Sodium/calcium exchanger membrane region domain-containing protein n=1 Tax=Cutaneotrichosporon oleaginosum TaxID=879819 RepID=A0A0J0XDZ2_9TREE|nr:uncharacterized protein CC85DRAFT_313933 [Cutaneotrichosporon oleaginosum]KLT39297.1 hypothetical protein CC85DRAFT_313933 [Cutaneotrichosporon oleaginosum]TXT08555.1 hypothetical protein COLE_05479 [Cutaneotrichosporon oleaginosum]